jgi:hypothetical protein
VHFLVCDNEWMFKTHGATIQINWIHCFRIKNFSLNKLKEEDNIENLNQNRMQKISWTDYLRNEEVLLRIKEQRNILHGINKRKANLIFSHFALKLLYTRSYWRKDKGGIEVTGRQGRRRRKVLDELKERRGYYHLKEEALDRTMWRAGFGRGFGPVVRQTTKYMSTQYQT